MITFGDTQTSLLTWCRTWSRPGARNGVMSSPRAKDNIDRPVVPLRKAKFKRVNVGNCRVRAVILVAKPAKSKPSVETFHWILPRSVVTDKCHVYGITCHWPSLILLKDLQIFR